MSAVPNLVTPLSPAAAIGAPQRSRPMPALIELISTTLAAEHSQLFIQPIDPVIGVAALRAHLAAIATSGSEAVLVARDGSSLSRLVTGTRGGHPARRGVIDIGIGVRAGNRSQGIGFAFTSGARSLGARREHVTGSSFVVTTNAPAIALYRKAASPSSGKRRSPPRYSTGNCSTSSKMVSSSHPTS